MSQKNPYFEPLGPIYGQNTALRVRWQWGLCLGTWGLSRFSAKILKNRIWGLLEAVSAKFFGGLKVAHGDSATDEPKKSGFRALEPDLWPKYRFARALAVGLMPSNLRT